MTRFEGDVREKPQPTVGAIRSSFEPYRPEWNPQGPKLGRIGFVSPRTRKPPCCKTCKGGGCTGRCKF